MITLIIGQNATGKSVYLKNRAKEAVRKNENIISNTWDTTYLNNRGYNAERIEALEEVFDSEEITENPEYLDIKTDEISIGKSFKDMLTMICREGDELYLDEPEYALNSREEAYLVSFLYRVLDTFKNIEIVTHSELFLGILEADRKTVILNDKNEYVLSDLKEDEYATID